MKPPHGTICVKSVFGEALSGRPSALTLASVLPTVRRAELFSQGGRSKEVPTQCRRATRDDGELHVTRRDDLPKTPIWGSRSF